MDAEELRDDLLEQMLEQGTLDGLEVSEVLGEFVSDPALRIDVNSVTEEELVATGLLTPYAAHQFVLVRLHRGGAFRSLRELKQIPGWDIRTLRRVLPYLALIPVRDPSQVVRSLGQGSLSGQLSLGVARGDFTNKPKTLGSPSSLDFRARYQVRHRLSLGVLGASQRGEPILQQRYPLLDRGGFHLSLQLPEYALRQLVVGDYRLKMGLGLVAYQGFMRGTELRLGMPLPSSPLQAALSADEENTLRGVATELGSSALRLALFYSDRRRDGILREGDNRVQLMATTGYHRTPLEWEHRHQAWERLVGGRIAFRVAQGSLAFNYLRMDWRGRLVQQLPHYGYLREAHDLSYLQHFSLDYRATSLSGQWLSAGEMALSSRGGKAALAYVKYRDLDRGEYTLSGRYLSPSYMAPLGNAPSRFAYPGNEMGCYMAAHLPLSDQLDLLLSWDAYRSLVARKGEEKPSRGGLLEVHAKYAFAPQYLFSTRYRVHYERDKGQRHSLHMRGVVPLSPGWKATIGAQVKRNHIRYVKRMAWHRGFSTSLQLDYTPTERLRIGGLGVFYQTDSFDERSIYYTPYVRTTHLLSTFYGKGIAGIGYVRWRIGEHWAVEAKVVTTLPMQPNRGTSRATPQTTEFALSLSLL
ncbi:hypothetical protein [Porphyromonas endodontalis]|uniref:hypothetical protein n=1 Tax=Porphyromonas endodontalis TaxID=28124 RepID=UPI0028EBBC68|nr:hypothetical protein [Porphyromonas endodontalis]